MQLPKSLTRIPFFSSLTAVGLSLLLSPQNAKAYDNKIDISFGAFSLTGTNSATSKSTSVSGLGAYQIRYRRAITRHLEFGAGYSLYYKQVFTGDSIYGLDFAVIYFPFTASGALESQSDDVNLVIEEKIRPFVAASFLQRNFQGIQTTYTGFCLGAGTEYSLTNTLSLLGYARYGSLSAGQDTSATEIAVSAGIVLGF